MFQLLFFVGARPGWLNGEHVGLMTWWLRVRSPVDLSPLQKHVGKVVSGFGKKSCVSTGVRKPGNTYASPTAVIMILAVKVALNPNTTKFVVGVVKTKDCLVKN